MTEECEQKAAKGAKAQSRESGPRHSTPSFPSFVGSSYRKKCSPVSRWSALFKSLRDRIRAHRAKLALLAIFAPPQRVDFLHEPRHDGWIIRQDTRLEIPPV